MLITFEGPDGSGKSTQLRLLSERLRANGYEVVESAEPGGSSIGRQVRRILLDPENVEMSPVAELLLMFAARAQNVDEIIRPALAAGRIVVSDRFTDSTLAYQGAGRGLGSELVLAVDRIACRGLAPDITICVDVPAEAGLARARARNSSLKGQPESRIDDQALEFHRRARAAYGEIAEREPERFRIVDGDGDPAIVAARVWAEVARKLPPGRLQRQLARSGN